MSWKSLPGYYNSGQNDQPRYLTKDEVEYILNLIPLAPAANRKAALLNRAEIQNLLRYDLESNKLAPSAIKYLVHEIIRQHDKSIISPGSTVGATSGEAVAGSSTQMTLNTFHQSGSINSVSSGIKAIQNLLYARNISGKEYEKCTIYFTTRLTYEEVLKARSYIVGSMIYDFVKDYKITTPDKLEPFMDSGSRDYIFGKN